MVKNPAPLALTQSDIYTIDSSLKKAIVAYNNDVSIRSACLVGEEFTLLDVETKGLKRQYIPYVDENGQKIVWLNCFCSDNDNWKKLE